jgi:hypothetical protein
MKTITRFGFVALMIAAPLGVEAAQPAGRCCERTWSGTVTLINTQDNTVTVKRAWLAKKFNLGEHCAIVAIDKKEAALSDLSPGERVTIRYQHAEGVRVADRIAERALRYGGTVYAVDQKAGTLTMEEAPLYRPFHAPERFRIASNCRVILWDGREGTLAELQPGEQISVTYELPGGSPVAYRIRDESSTFVGTIEAIDLPDRTLKAKELLGEKKFTLGDDCRIFLADERAGHLKDLVLGRKYKFTYEEVNGVNVLNRIAPAQEGKHAETASTK